MDKKITCFLLAFILIFTALPMGALAEETSAFTGKPPAVMIITGGDTQTFIYGGRVWSARNSGSYPNNAPDSVDTVEEKVDWIAEQCRASGAADPWEIALWLHNWLIYNANYDYTYSNYSADGVLLLGTGVCNSYALAYGLLLDEFGIENMKLDSDAMNHAWNLVKINGQWCHVDCTWDDPGDGGFENFTYFGMDDELMGRDHTWDRAAYPVCTSKENYYLIRTGASVATNKAEMMMELSKQAERQSDLIECSYIGTDPNFSVIEVFQEWYNTFNWKYGIYGWSCSYTDFMISATMSYGTPWSKPDDFDQTHTHCYVTEKTAPTCGEAGYTTYICPCDYSYQDDYVDPTGKHTYSSAQDTTCNVCGKEISSSEHNHDYTEEVISPTCTEAGYTQYICSCGDSYQGDVVEALGHKWIVADCDTPKICSVCQETEGKPAGHKYDDNVDGTCNSCGVNRETVEVRQVTHMLRMYNPYTGEHFYTGSEVEKNDLVAAGWHYEGVGFTFPGNTGAPVYRLYDPVTGEHLYTMDEEEKATLEAAGWNYEGIAFNSAYDTEAVQHRLHNPYATVGAYHFTYSIEERDNLIAAGWEYQGIGWYSCY